jgi:hypothetical protein
MSKPKKARAKANAPNPGWFQKGFDPRRHPLSRLDCRKGDEAAPRA